MGRRKWASLPVRQNGLYFADDIFIFCKPKTCNLQISNWQYINIDITSTLVKIMARGRWWPNSLPHIYVSNSLYVNSLSFWNRTVFLEIYNLCILIMLGQFHRKWISWKNYKRLIDICSGNGSVPQCNNIWLVPILPTISYHSLCYDFWTPGENFHFH